MDQGDGNSLRNHLLSYKRQSGVTMPELIGPEMPPFVNYLWEWFYEIASGRPRGPGGEALPIPNMEILAWCTINRTALSSFELRCIRMMDRLWIQAARGKLRFEGEGTDD